MLYEVITGTLVVPACQAELVLAETRMGDFRFGDVGQDALLQAARPRAVSSSTRVTTKAACSGMPL